MPRFEVSCSAAPPSLPADASVRVEAEHWLAALKAGLEKAGRPPLGANVLCDVQPDGVVQVTAPAAGAALFRVRELRADLPPLPRAAGETGSDPAAEPPSAVGARRRGVGARGPAAARPPDEILASLFERVAELDRQRDRRGGLGLLLDLALEAVEAEAGAAFVARLGARTLEVAVARGPRADELLGASVPVGVGIVGFCARENVAVAVADAQRDPRFHPALSKAIGYETRSLLCAPVAASGRVLGAIEVLDKRGGAPFDKTDLAVVSYLAHQAAAFLDRVGT
jgi:hypothetical protein